MFKFFILVVFFTAFCGCKSDSPILSKLTDKSNRQKRLLFYDEQGTLVNTLDNYLNYYGQRKQPDRFDLGYLNVFLNPFRQTILGPTQIAYMIPVSDAVIQTINTDPVYQNKLFILSNKDPIVKTDPLCAGKRVQIPSPNLCSNFLNCWDGWAFEQECPAGLLFSDNGYCDYPYLVNCNNRKLKEQPRPLCSNDFEAYKNKGDCTEFFVCANNVPVRFKCPADLAYNERLGVCDYRSLVECNTSVDDAKEDVPAPSPATQQEVTGSTEAYTKAAVIASSDAPSTTSENNVHSFNNMEYNTQTWSSTHVAISRQDAIRKLNLDKIAEVKYNY